MNRHILVIMFFTVIMFGLVHIASTPEVVLPQHWDCSETAYYTFKNEQRIGHEPVLVVGYSLVHAHTWVENKEGDVIVGGSKQWCYETYTDRYYYKGEIPKRSPFGYKWKKERILT